MDVPLTFAVTGTGAFAARDAVVRGSILAAIIAVPSLTAFLASWAILDDVITAAVIGGVVHFVAMGFSLRISRRLARKTGGDP